MWMLVWGATGVYTAAYAAETEALYGEPLEFEVAGMTVREAFAKAGHPVPDDAMVGYSNITGTWRWGTNDAHGSWWRWWAK